MSATQLIKKAGGISDIVEDTSPQLGGDLSLNGNNIDFPTVSNISDCKDEDTMSSNSATMLATQQSIKAYVDRQDACVMQMGGRISGDAASTSVYWYYPYGYAYSPAYYNWQYYLLKSGISDDPNDTSIAIPSSWGSNMGYKYFQWTMPFAATVTDWSCIVSPANSSSYQGYQCVCAIAQSRPVDQDYTNDVVISQIGASQATDYFDSYKDLEVVGQTGLSVDVGVGDVIFPLTRRCYNNRSGSGSTSNEYHTVAYTIAFRRQ